MVLQLADHSIRLPKEVVENVLPMVGEFKFFVALLYLRLKSLCVSKIKCRFSLIVFPSYVNALINCEDGKMKLSFGNMN